MTEIHESIADLARGLVDSRPDEDEKVIDFATPDELLAEFDRTVGLELGDDVPAADPALLAAAAELVVKRSVHTTHPRFLNQNFAGADPVAVVGDWLAAALNTTNATFEAAPVFTLMEGAVLDKLARLAGYPDGPGPAPGMFCPGGSTATLYALQLARHRAQPNLIAEGGGSERLAMFVSDAGHYAAAKSAAMLGIGVNAVVEVATDHSGAIDPTALEAAVTNAQADRRRPFAVIATSGTTVTAAFDDLNALADVCEESDMWLHVDGCYGGSALFSARHRQRMAGVERSDSFAWNLHKMMGMTQQCSALLIRDPTALAPTFSTGADYIFQPDKQHGELDAGDRTFQCGRRVDVLKLWLAWKAAGDAGFEARVDHAVAMADHARALIEASDELVAVVAGDFTNVCFTWVPPELRPLDVGELEPAARARLHTLAPKIKARMQADGTAMLGFQPVHGLNVFRLIVMNPAVSAADIEAVIGLVAAYGRECWTG